MPKGWHTLYIDRDPDDPYQGWGWVDVKVIDIRKFNIPFHYPKTYYQVQRSSVDRRSLPNYGNLPSRGKAGGKRFSVNLDGELIELRVQKSLNIDAVNAWVKTWATPTSVLITPGRRSLPLSGEPPLQRVHHVYFILNPESRAIKIGYAKNVERRLKALQTSSPVPLTLIKVITVEGGESARLLEQSFHQKFQPYRLSGEWFRAEKELLEHLAQLSETDSQ